jgi:hypothetical protein
MKISDNISTEHSVKPLRRNERQCSLCKQWKHRQRFKPKKSADGAYDYRCVECRRLPFDPQVKKRRLSRGLVTAAQVEAEKKAIKEKQRENGRQRLLEYYINQWVPTWDKPLESSLRMRNVLHQAMSKGRHTYNINQLEHIGDMLDYIHDCRFKMLVCRTKEFCPNPTAQFWYDVDAEWARQMRMFAAEWPEGEAPCPVVIL